MPQDNQSLPQGAGATTATTTSGTTGETASSARGSGSSSFQAGYGSGQAAGSVAIGRDEHESGYRSSGRAVILTAQRSSAPSTAMVVGAAVAGAIVGGALPFMFAGRSSSSGRSSSREDARVEETVVINRPARELYDFWRNFENLPRFMDNVESVRSLGGDGRRSHWKIKAPAGTSVEFDSFVTDDEPGRLIAWASEEGASVPNRGRVEFSEASSGSTVVRVSMSYEPPAGVAGRAVAKLFGREPQLQARQDLQKFKEVMEGQAARK